MPSEMITLYTKADPNTPVSCDRTEYYDNDLTTYANHYPALIDVFLFNTFGDVLLQRRGRNKRKNPYKLHTTIGGHINWGESPEFSLVHESMEELGAPTLLFPQAAYSDAVKKLEGYANRAALVYEVKEYFRDFRMSNIKELQDVKDRIWLYFGLYNGPVDTPDRSSAGYEWINLDTLVEEIKNSPAQFTSGLVAYIEELEADMRQFVARYCSQVTQSVGSINSVKLNRH